MSAFDAQSGHRGGAERCPLLGVKWTSKFKSVTPLSHLRATVLVGLFVIADAAALVANFCNKGLFRNRLSRSGLREVIVYREDTSP
jgi:hypothetical protein